MFRPITNTKYVALVESYLTPTKSIPEVVNVGAVPPANCVPVGQVTAYAPAFVNRMYTTSDVPASNVLVNAIVVAAVIVIVNSVAVPRFRVCVAAEGSATTP